MKRKNEEAKQTDDSMRDKIRQKKRRKSVFSGFIVLIILVALGGLGYVLYENVVEVYFRPTGVMEEEKVDEEKVEIINENNDEAISSRVTDYIELLKGDLKELDLNLLRVVLPKGKMREIDVDIEGVMPYFKVNVDRDSAVTAEDISRMINYLRERNLMESVSYIDVRVEGKAFYK